MEYFLQSIIGGIKGFEIFSKIGNQWTLMLYVKCIIYLERMKKYCESFNK